MHIEGNFSLDVDVENKSGIAEEVIMQMLGDATKLERAAFEARIRTVVTQMLTDGEVKTSSALVLPNGSEWNTTAEVDNG